MHPTSIGQLNLFGEYTPRFMALVEAQLAIKNGRYDDAKTVLDGRLAPYINEIEKLAERDIVAAKKAAADLRYGLKIAINIVYGLTSAKFDNPFKDNRNVDNIVAKRGALFMIDLKHFIQEQGFTVAHIKTDSVKIPNATPEIIEAVQNFGTKYGYTFEHEATYDKLGLVNDAVYIAHYDESAPVNIKNGKKGWTATGSQYQHPYVFKKLFGLDDTISYLDLRETKHVQQGVLFLDFGGHHNDTYTGWIDGAVAAMKEAEKAKDDEKKRVAELMYRDAVDQLIHVGRTGQFTPVLPGHGGGQLWRMKDGKHYAVTGTKGHMWIDSQIGMGLPDDAIDYAYFDDLVTDATNNLVKFVPTSSFETVEEFLG
jgi:hypothetical protein